MDCCRCMIQEGDNMKRRTSIRMTEGTIWKQLLLFSMPLFVGNVFQLLYNTVDAAVVGNYVGSEALAAVGSTGSIINMVICFSLGLSAGGSVVISQYFGARDWDKLHISVHTTVVMTALLSVVLSLVSVPAVPMMLRAMSTPEDVFPLAESYLKIYFSGLTGLLMYNAGASILRAVGDSTWPLIFLILSTLLNLALDLVFVVKVGMGVEGVAYATILSQYISAILCFVLLFRTRQECRVRWREMRVHMATLKLILKIGIPTAVQQVLTSFSNVFVQGHINVFGADCMAGWTSYAKVDAFAQMPNQSLSLAASTFVGQNIGAEQMDRAKKGVNVTMMLSMGITFVLTAAVMILANPLLKLFNQDPEVLEFGRLFVLLLSPFYLVAVVNTTYASALRGAGDTKAPMYILLGSYVLFRQLYLMVVSALTDSVVWVAMSYPAGWAMASIILTVYYRRSDWNRKRVGIHNPS